MRTIILGIVFANAAGVCFAEAPKANETLLVVEPSKEHPRNSEGDILAMKDGRLAFVYTQFSGGSADGSSADLVLCESADNGRTWSKPRMLVPRGDARNVMSVSLLRLPDGEILLFYLLKTGPSTCTMYVQRSRDELATVGDPVRVTPAEGYYVVNNGRVLRTKKGRLIVPAVLHPHRGPDHKTWTPEGIPHAFYSDDNGRTWKGGASDAEQAEKTAVVLQEPGVEELKDGRLIMWFRTDKSVQYQSYSSDGGEHWTLPEPGPLVSAAFSPASIRRIPWTGDLLCVWNDHSTLPASTQPSKKRTPLCVAISKDEGRTWSKSRVIEPDPDGWYCYTSITFQDDRVILSYCAGDKKVGGLNRLKVIALSRDWLYEKE